MIISDSIVVGGGVIGSMLARSLAERGNTVTILEREWTQGQPPGISKSSKAINVRGDLPHWEAHVRSKGLWESLLKELKIPFRVVDQVTLGHRDAQFMKDFEKVYKERGIEFYAAYHPSILQKYFLRIEPENYAIIEPNSVILVDGAKVVTRLHQTFPSGVEIKYGKVFKEITEASEGVVRGTLEDGSSFECSSLFLCAGPWAQKLLGNFNLDLGITNTAQQTSLLYFDAQGDARAKRLPYLHDRRMSDWNTHGVGMFVVPPIDDFPVKVGRRGCGPKVDIPYSDELDVTLDTQVQEYCAQAFDGISPKRTQMEQCYYPTNPTDKIILGETESHPEVYFAAGCYGAAFKLSPVIGDALATYALEGEGNVPQDMKMLVRNPLSICDLS